MGVVIPQPHGGAMNRWLPGESGNPNGKRKGPNFKTIAQKFLKKEITIEDFEGTQHRMTKQEAIVFKLIEDAFNNPDPNVRRAALNTLYDRVEGKPATQGQEGVEDSNEATAFAALSVERKAEILRLLGIKAVQEIDITPHEELEPDADQ